MGCFLRDSDGQLIAGLGGFTWGGYAKDEWLWVRDDHRRRGCGVVRVDTHTFQALGFYEQLGYKRIGFAAGTPTGHGEVFFLKQLTTNGD